MESRFASVFECIHHPIITIPGSQTQPVSANTKSRSAHGDEQMDNNAQPMTGTISRVSANSVVYVLADSDSTRSVTFTPAKVEGYAGQELAAFGLVPGGRVTLRWNPASGKVVGPVKLT